MNKASTEQIGGSHYKDYAIQPAEFVHRNKIGFLEGNAIKYLCRHKTKNGLQDLQKAKHYIELLIEWEYSIAETPKSVSDEDIILKWSKPIEDCGLRPLVSSSASAESVGEGAPSVSVEKIKSICEKTIMENVRRAGAHRKAKNEFSGPKTW